MRNRIVELRKRQGLSQEALGDVLLVSRQTINAIEKGRYLPSLPLALKLARHFATPVEDLFELEPGD